MCPETPAPVVSVRYLPTTPLEFASPFGNWVDFELSRSRAVSIALAASTTTFARTCSSVPVFLSMYDDAVRQPVRADRHFARHRVGESVSLPVCSAGAISTSPLEKFAFTWQPRLHWPQ